MPRSDAEGRLFDTAVRVALVAQLAFAVVRLAIGVRRGEPFDLDQTLALTFGLLALFLLGSELQEAWQRRFPRRGNGRNIVE